MDTAATVAWLKGLPPPAKGHVWRGTNFLDLRQVEEATGRVEETNFGLDLRRTATVHQVSELPPPGSTILNPDSMRHVRQPGEQKSDSRGFAPRFAAQNPLTPRHLPNSAQADQLLVEDLNALDDSEDDDGEAEEESEE